MHRSLGGDERRAAAVTGVKGENVGGGARAKAGWDARRLRSRDQTIAERRRFVDHSDLKLLMPMSMTSTLVRLCIFCVDSYFSGRGIECGFYSLLVCP